MQIPMTPSTSLVVKLAIHCRELALLHYIIFMCHSFKTIAIAINLYEALMIGVQSQMRSNDHGEVTFEHRNGRDIDVDSANYVEKALNFIDRYYITSLYHLSRAIVRRTKGRLYKP